MRIKCFFSLAETALAVIFIWLVFLAFLHHSGTKEVLLGQPQVRLPKILRELKLIFRKEEVCVGVDMP